MSGICGTCKIKSRCISPEGGLLACPLYEQDRKSRWHELFGTPERAARTLARMCQGIKTCGTCPLFGAALNHCKNDYTDFASIAEWLRGDA